MSFCKMNLGVMDWPHMVGGVSSSSARANSLFTAMIELW